MDIEGSRQRLQEITISTNNVTKDNVTDNDDPSRDDQIRFNKLCKNARKAAEEGQPRQALECYMKAAEIHATEKISRRISKLQAYLEEHGSEDSTEEDESGMVHVGKGFCVYKDVYNLMYPHQREAMLWFWRLHRKNKGGILGDDMGLGKTIQVIAFLSGLFDMEEVHSVLLILPVAVIINWEKEFEKWAPGMRVETFHGGNKRERLRSLAKVQRHGGVLMTSYGLVVTQWETLGTRDGRQFVWDYTILDEGHKIKNPSKTTKGCHCIVSKHRFILTGTPIQNNLKEFWFLFDFVTQGSLLGTQKTFQMEYAGPITRSREKDATASEKLLGNQMAESLRQLIAPYFLRRTKADVLEKSVSREKDATASEKLLGNQMAESLRQLIAPYFLRRTKADVLEKNKENQARGDDVDIENQPGTSSKVVSFPTLTRKNDFVVWCFLTEKQIKIYNDFLQLDQVKELLMTSRSPLVELTILKKLCDHLRLLSVRACMQLGMDTGIAEYDEEDETLHKQSAADKIQHMSNEELLAESGKLQMLMELLQKLSGDGHRTLVFSQSRKMLDIIEKLLRSENYKYMRLDGTISKLDDRQQRINRFQKNRSYTVFLLTTQVGGVGLTLTGADRVVICDPSWNPATDNQAVDRVYRIGQKETVVVYRLITCGTVEEKIYRRQIFKQSITQQTVGHGAAAKNPYRYFTKGELYELFTLDNPRVSTTQQQLEEMHSAQRKTDVQLDEHIAFLYSLNIFGISDHDLMFSKEAVIDHDADEIEEAEDYIQHRVNKAKELITAEAELTNQLREQLKDSTEHAGSSNRRHTLYTDREQLLEAAQRQGHDVGLPQQRPRWTESKPPPAEVVDLDEYSDSIHSIDDQHNSTHGSSSIEEDHSVADSNHESFLQDVISNLSPEELAMNMQLLAENKAQQQQQQQQLAQQQAAQLQQYQQQRAQQQPSHEDGNMSNLNESSFLEDVLAESSNQSDSNKADESSLENVEVADQSAETSTHLPTSNQLDSSLEEVEVADQSVETSYHGNKSIGKRDGDNGESSLEEVEVADQSLETSAIDDRDSSLEEVEVADQSLETSVHVQDEEVNVSMQAMKLEDDVVNLSMDDLAKADTLDVCDDLDLHIPTPKKSARKSSSILAPSPLGQPNQKKRHPSSLLSMMNDSTASNSSPRVVRTKILVDESPTQDTPASDESEKRKKRKSDDSLSSSEEKRKYVEEDDDDDDDSLPWRCGARRERPLRIQDLDESEQDNSVFVDNAEDGITVIQESDEETADDSYENAPLDHSEHGSYLTDSRKKNPLTSIQNDSATKIPTPREMLQYTFDSTSGGQVKLGASEITEESDTKQTGSREDDSIAWTKTEEDFVDKTVDDEQFDNDATVDESMDNDVAVDESMDNDAAGDESMDNDDNNRDISGEVESEEKIDGDTTNEDIQDEEGDDAEDMTLNSEDSFDEEEDEDEEEEDEEDEYTTLVRQGEHYLRRENEAKALECFLQALKIDKSDRTLQMKTLTLYQKLSKK